MKPITRELMSGTAAVAALGGAVVSGAVPLVGCIAAGGLVYAGLRLFLPADPPKTTVSQRESILNESNRQLISFHGQVEQIPSGPFRVHNRELADVLRQIIQRATEYPEQVELDEMFPTRIGQLIGLLTKYNQVAMNANHTDAVQSAVEHTEEVFERALEGFRRLLEQQIDKDAVRLIVDARVYDELLNIQMNLEGVDSIE